MYTPSEMDKKSSIEDTTWKFDPTPVIGQPVKGQKGGKEKIRIAANETMKSIFILEGVKTADYKTQGFIKLKTWSDIDSFINKIGTPKEKLKKALVVRSALEVFKTKSGENPQSDVITQLESFIYKQSMLYFKETIQEINKIKDPYKKLTMALEALRISSDTNQNLEGILNKVERLITPPMSIYHVQDIVIKYYQPAFRSKVLEIKNYVSNSANNNHVEIIKKMIDLKRNIIEVKNRFDEMSDARLTLEKLAFSNKLYWMYEANFKNHEDVPYAHENPREFKDYPNGIDQLLSHPYNNIYRESFEIGKTTKLDNPILNLKNLDNISSLEDLLVEISTAQGIKMGIAYQKRGDEAEIRNLKLVQNLEKRLEEIFKKINESKLTDESESLFKAGINGAYLGQKNPVQAIEMIKDIQKKYGLNKPDSHISSALNGLVADKLNEIIKSIDIDRWERADGKPGLKDDFIFGEPKSETPKYKAKLLIYFIEDYIEKHASGVEELEELNMRFETQKDELKRIIDPERYAQQERKREAEANRSGARSHEQAEFNRGGGRANANQETEEKEFEETGKLYGLKFDLPGEAVSKDQELKRYEDKKDLFYKDLFQLTLNRLRRGVREAVPEKELFTIPGEEPIPDIPPNLTKEEVEKIKEEIKKHFQKAYYKITRACHPDKHLQDGKSEVAENATKLINGAWDLMKKKYGIN